MKRITLITLCLTMSLCAMAQWNQQGGNGGRDRRQFSPENYNKELESFVTRDAGLTESEAQRLFPMIHKMLELERQNNMEATRLMASCNENSSEADYERTLKKCLALEIDNKTIEQTYYKKFHSVLSWKKIHKVRGALFKFNMYALRRFSPPGQGGQSGRWNNGGQGGQGGHWKNGGQAGPGRKN